MPRPPRLSPDDVAAALDRLPAWSGGADGIERTLELPSFRAAAEAVSMIADVAEQLDHHEAPLSLIRYMGSSDFWNRTLQNWQSEFLAVGSMAIFAVYLRQRGSPESKPVGAPHEATAQSG